MKNLVLMSYYFPPMNAVAARRGGALYNFLDRYSVGLEAATGMGILSKNVLIERTKRRFLDQYFWVIESINIASSRRGSRFFLTCGPSATYLIALYIICFDRTARVHIDIRDLWADNPLKKRGLLRQLLVRHIEAFLLNRVHSVSVVSPFMQNILEAKYARNIKVVLNGYDAPPRRGRPVGKHTNIKVAYFGTFYKGHRDHPWLFEAFSSLSSIVSVDLYGRGQQSLPDWVRELPSVKLMGEVSHREAVKKQDTYDFLLYISAPDEKTFGAIPAKLFEYMGAQSTIVGCGISENDYAGSLILETRTGILAGASSHAVTALFEEIYDNGFMPMPLNEYFCHEFSREAQFSKLPHYIVNAKYD
jgi:glycosyltransferase involved in cell wall biosynthesis